MIPYWPDELPQRVLRDGFSLGAADGRLSTKMDAGPPKVRRRFSAAVRPLQAAFIVSVDGVARFDRFWNEQIRGGSLPFLIPDQVKDGLRLLTEAGQPLLTEAGTPLVVTSWWLVLAGDTAPSTVNVAGAWFKISFPLVVMP